MDLPKLSNTPARHPDLCLSISTKLLQTLTTILTEDASPGTTTTSNSLILSVGSGTGLLEAHLQHHLTSPGPQTPTAPPTPRFTVKGVEVRAPSSAAAPVNKYLPDHLAATVRGTWEVSPLVGGADALVFVYPRDPGLVRRYLEEAKARSALRVVLWLGPRADWDVFGGCFSGLEGGFGEVSVVLGGDAGVAEFEMLAVVNEEVHGSFYEPMGRP